MARKSKYEIIKANFAKIEQLLSNGITEREVARSIGVAYSTWNKYKNAKKEFSELIKKSREHPVDDLIHSMYKSGKGFKETIKDYVKLKRDIIDPLTGKKVGQEEYLQEIEREIYIPPNFQPAKFLVLNWGKDLGYSSEPKAMELRERELEHKIEQDKINNW